MRLVRIPEDKYYDYRIQAMFDCYKWDPQFCDSNTLAKYILVLIFVNKSYKSGWIFYNYKKGAHM